MGETLGTVKSGDLIRIQTTKRDGDPNFEFTGVVLGRGDDDAIVIETGREHDGVNELFGNKAGSWICLRPRENTRPVVEFGTLGGGWRTHDDICFATVDVLDV